MYLYRNKDFLYRLESFHGEKKLPVIAYVEICIYFIEKKKRNQNWVDRFLQRVGVEVEWLNKNFAKNIIQYAVAGKDFREKARDYLIGAHAYPPPRTLITYNKKDFTFLGNRVFTPEEIELVY